MLAKFVVAMMGVVGAMAQGQVVTPASITQCVPVAITFTGSAPFNLAILPGGQVSAVPLLNFGTQTSPFVWTANLTSGTSITFRLTDASGNPAYSAPVSIQPGSNSCLAGAAVVSSLTGSAASSASISASSVSASVVSTLSSAAAASTTAASSTAAASSTSAAAASTSRPATSSVAAATSSVAAATSSVVASLTSAAAAATTAARSSAESTSAVGKGLALALGLIGGAVALL